MGTDMYANIEKQNSTGSWLSYEVDIDRCYALFAILANVRNYGHTELNTIVEPRGLPKGTHHMEEGYSSSWLTLNELLEFDWTQKNTIRGVVSIDQWARWKLFGEPNSWSTSVMGIKVKMVTPQELETYVESRKLNLYDLMDRDYDISDRFGKRHVFTTVEWTKTYAESCVQFWTTLIPEMLRLSGGDHTKVRLVFSFDC